jgi:hypothetical protein
MRVAVQRLADHTSKWVVVGLPIEWVNRTPLLVVEGHCPVAISASAAGDLSR